MQGTLDVLVLNALATGPLHGYGVVDWIRHATGDALQIEDGALYTALHRMERRGWLSPEWGVSPKGRRARVTTASPLKVAGRCARANARGRVTFGPYPACSRPARRADVLRRGTPFAADFQSLAPWASGTLGPWHPS